MTDITFADISEFQADFQAPAYLKAGHKVVIVRAHNGYRNDYKWPARRDYVRKQPFVCVGYYQYLVAGRDAADQAHAFIAAVGKLAPNEFPIVDLEEGGGNQTGRADAWFAVVDPWAGFHASLYTGNAMLNAQLGGASHWNRPVWIASYPSSYTANPQLEPAGADWWQYSDREHFPGLTGGVDASIHHGTAEHLLALVRSGSSASAPGPTPPKPEDYMAIAVAELQGVPHVFVEDSKGAVWYTWQKKGETGWHGGEAGKSIAGLRPFAPAPK